MGVKLIKSKGSKKISFAEGVVEMREKMKVTDR